MKKIKIQVEQQGDVVLVPNQKDYSVSPVGTKQAKNPATIQEGEHTGHAHRMTKNPGLLLENAGTRYLRVGEDGTTITHEEHTPCEIEQGDYEVRIVRQKDPFSKIVSRVVD